MSFTMKFIKLILYSKAISKIFPVIFAIRNYLLSPAAYYYEAFVVSLTCTVRLYIELLWLTVAMP